MDHFAGAIRAYRISKGYTCREFADILGINVRSLTGWESGRSCPKCASLIIEALTNGNGNEKPVTVVDWYLMAAVLTLSKAVFVQIKELEEKIPLIEEALKMTKYKLSGMDYFAR